MILSKNVHFKSSPTFGETDSVCLGFNKKNSKFKKSVSIYCVYYCFVYSFCCLNNMISTIFRIFNANLIYESLFWAAPAYTQSGYKHEAIPDDLFFTNITLIRLKLQQCLSFILMIQSKLESLTQKQSPRGNPCKGCSENIQQNIFHKNIPCQSAISRKLLCNHTSAWVFSCEVAAYFQNTFSEERLWVAASAHCEHGLYLSKRSLMAKF